MRNSVGENIFFVLYNCTSVKIKNCFCCISIFAWKIKVKKEKNVILWELGSTGVLFYFAMELPKIYNSILWNYRTTYYGMAHKLWAIITLFRMGVKYHRICNIYIWLNQYFLIIFRGQTNFRQNDGNLYYDEYNLYYKMFILYCFIQLIVDHLLLATTLLQTLATSTLELGFRKFLAGIRKPGYYVINYIFSFPTRRSLPDSQPSP